MDTAALAQRMLDEDYLIAPGALFHAARKPSTLTRINFATTQEAAFWKMFARLRDGMKRISTRLRGILACSPMNMGAGSYEICSN